MQITNGLRRANPLITVHLPPDVAPAALAPFVADMASFAGDVAMAIREVRPKAVANIDVHSQYLGLQAKCIHTADALLGAGLKPAPLGGLPVDQYDLSYADLVMGMRKHLSMLETASNWYQSTNRLVIKEDGYMAEPYEKKLRIAINQARRQAETMGRYTAWRAARERKQPTTFLGAQ